MFKNLSRVNVLGRLKHERELSQQAKQVNGLLFLADLRMRRVLC